MFKKIFFVSGILVSSIQAEPIQSTLGRLHIDSSYKSEFACPNKMKKVAVVDTGFDRQHDLLRDVVSISHGIIPKGRFSAISKVESAALDESIVCELRDDDYGKQSSHGTHVAGIAAAAFGEWDNFKPVVPVKISENRSYDPKFVSVLKQLKLRDDIVCVNMSWGFGGTKDNHAIARSVKKAMLDVMKSDKLSFCQLEIVALSLIAMPIQKVSIN